MAKENIRKFLEEISTNKELQEKLIEVQKGYEAEGKGEEDILEDILIPIAKEAGYEFTISEYKNAQREAMAEKGISEEELENVSGGWSVCFFIGFSNSDVAACVISGVDRDNDKKGIKGDGVGLGLCFYVGFGAGFTL